MNGGCALCGHSVGIQGDCAVVPLGTQDIDCGMIGQADVLFGLVMGHLGGEWVDLGCGYNV